jgi:hypothetical protein
LTFNLKLSVEDTSAICSQDHEAWGLVDQMQALDQYRMHWKMKITLDVLHRNTGESIGSLGDICSLFPNMQSDVELQGGFEHKNSVFALSGCHITHFPIGQAHIQHLFFCTLAFLFVLILLQYNKPRIESSEWQVVYDNRGQESVTQSRFENALGMTWSQPKCCKRLRCADTITTTPKGPRLNSLCVQPAAHIYVH